MGLQRRSEQVVPRTVLNARLTDCRWVTRRRTSDGFRVFCGGEAENPLRPYCKDHYRLVYRRVRKTDVVEI